MSATVTYKGATLTTATNQTRVLETAGKYMEDDVTITDVTQSSPSLQSKTVTPTTARQVVAADSGYDALSSVTIEPIPSNYGLITWDGSVLTVS